MGVTVGMPWPGAEIAAEAEAVGFGAFCTGEFVDHEAYARLGEMVGATSSARVGTAIAYAFARTPYAHATAARTLAARAPGRVFLGLGSGAFTINRDWFGVPADRPVARTADLVRAVRTWLHAENGERVRYEGEFYSIDADVRAPVLGRVDVPVLLGGFNKGMAAAAGRVADGIIGHGLFTRSWWDDVVRPAVAKGRTESDRVEPHLEHGWVITAVDDEAPERAVADARRMIAFYLTVKTYDPYVAHHGWEEPVAALRAAFRSGDTEGMAAAVTDEMVEAIAVCGTTATAREMLAARAGSLPADVAYLAPPSFMVSGRRKAAYFRASLGLRDAVLS
ncbi:alkanesulfonate monooxygenase SsuD/methylene tetrahydromethanopterin reductase-like flavin-dependent oxidoreductase (luciferase family) [Prauserella sediminis]|uniref:Alkanesulfonate monooxygenase SsuD/methylene tetrahydromethanopterin reductase-like flavin-dependent oxidoreductase (Luciferase family) n=1 Tax=Prauserella sediminis TaxID=577680 RepID=A0A839XWZ3_9PSEU|nr:LLM class flavin-dependent oxidoreductase [Prauserella sediminis]MBB3665598.1 alkanesulfonate monooxygenase SsuD/methylene tetrahydromethanopterin reductase-like flavin-dependent oxidoreductase (luciferase family) [Prauserella sediminis]